MSALSKRTRTHECRIGARDPDQCLCSSREIRNRYRQTIECSRSTRHISSWTRSNMSEFSIGFREKLLYELLSHESVVKSLCAHVWEAN